MSTVQSLKASLMVLWIKESVFASMDAVASSKIMIFWTGEQGWLWWLTDGNDINSTSSYFGYFFTPEFQSWKQGKDPNASKDENATISMNWASQSVLYSMGSSRWRHKAWTIKCLICGSLRQGSSLQPDRPACLPACLLVMAK